MQRFRFVAFLCVLLAALAGPGPAAAQSQDPAQATVGGAANAPATSATPAEGAEALLRLLQDPGARQALIDYLGREAGAPAPDAASGGATPSATAQTSDAQPSDAPPSDAPPAEGDQAGDKDAAEAPHIAVRIATFTENLIDEGIGFLQKIRRPFANLPAGLSSSLGADWKVVQGIALQLLLLGLVVFATLLFLRKLADRVFARLVVGAEKATIVKRVSLLFARALSEAVVVAIALGVGYVTAVLTGAETRRVELVESLFLNAFFFVQIAKVSTRFALSPKFSALRLVPLDDAQALYWRRWLFAIFNVLVYGTMVVVPLVSTNLSFLLANSLRMMIVLTSVFMAIVAILLNRKATRDRILEYASDRTNVVASGAIELVARSWHLLAIFYVLLLLTVWLARPFDATTFMIRASVYSVLAVMIGTLVSLALTRTITGGVRLPSNVHARLPLLERRLNAFIPRMLAILRFGVFVGVVLAILQAWGAIDVLNWSASSDGQDWIGRALSAGIVLLISFLIWLSVMSWIDLRLNPRGRLPTSREKTLFGLFRNAFSIILVVMASLLALSEIGVNIGPLIAGAGVFGLAISFGSQKLVQDIITGAFIQLENAMNEGDVVTLGGVTGVVEKLTIRSVCLRDLDGTAHVIPFSTVDRVANFMRDYAYHVAAIGVAYDSDISEVKMAMHVAFDRLKEGDLGADILEPLEMHGVTMFGDSAITVRARIKTTPGTQWAIGRAYNEHVKTVFDERGIEIPFPQVTYHSAAAPAAADADVEEEPAKLEDGSARAGRKPQKPGRNTPASRSDMPEGEDEL
ncbi:mechanosensitive ion channel [Stappia stellulata]|uniref:mechanosensitive ion channel domain-containing protein n=1 Tax=Stappia stellulata TaxID=71235 RepID=UPI001CD34DA7|nr:mechanosensitive ion channel domain-containing protein [Stappia stellulata]MCA1243913.1 mechanosensitive ion channel [Stappia stellulata]